MCTISALDAPALATHIHWSCVLTYTKDIPRASAFFPFIRNQVIEPYIVYIDRLVAENIHFHTYITHCETHSIDDIAFQSGWLACRSF